MNYIDLFAGAGGLSEGFISAGFKPVAHVEMNPNACDTLKTRLAYHYLKEKKKSGIYNDYLQNKISREKLWGNLPESKFKSVINAEISVDTMQQIFRGIDLLLDGGKVDVIVGGPPCQAYSLVGRSRDPNRMEGDHRNYLFKHYVEFLKKYKPKYFVFENVLGLLSAGNRKYLDEMWTLFKEVGYKPEYRVLSAEKYGVLQERKRIVIIGRLGKGDFEFPEPEEVENCWSVKNDLLYDLPSLKPGDGFVWAPYSKHCNDYLEFSGIRNGESGVTQHLTRPHNERDLEIYRMAIAAWLDSGERLKYSDVPENLQSHKNRESFLDRYKVVNHKGSSHTVVAHIAKDGHYYIYPDKRQVRSLSVREAARIQSFPDNYFFEGGRTAAFAQVGNAVPPLLAKAIANKMKNLL
jgi:DNA (cytosine-5)-methyltransferase 1